ESGALQTWIDTNAYKIPDESREYLKLYVEQEFYFVVFNFKPADKLSDESVVRDTQFIRIRYNYKEPFYPFREAVGERESSTKTEGSSSLDQSVTPEERREIYSGGRDFRLSLLTKGPVYSR